MAQPRKASKDRFDNCTICTAPSLEHLVSLTVDGTAHLIKALVQVVYRVVEGENDELGQSLRAHVACNINSNHQL